MRVLHSTLELGQTWLFRLIDTLPAEIESHVVTQRCHDPHGFGLRNLTSRHALSPRRYWWERVARRVGLRRALWLVPDVARRCEPDVLHSHGGPVGWADVAANRRLGLPHVVSFYGGGDVPELPLRRPVWRARYRELFERADRCLCEGPALRRELLELGCPPDKVHLHELGVDLASLPFVPRQFDRAGPLRLLICGLFAERKGFPDAIAAIGRVAREIPLELTLIGGPKNARQELEAQRIDAAIDAATMRDRTRVLGFVPQQRLIEEAYRHHVFVSPSKRTATGDSEGGAPVAILEMAATGMPVLSTRHADIPNFLEDGVAALLAEEGDVDGIAERLLWLARNEGAWGSIAAKARATIEARFDVHLRAVALAAQYQRAVEITGSQRVPKSLITPRRS